MLLPIATALASGGVLAQDFPGRPLRLIVPYAAGGSTDINGRLVANEMSKSLKQPVVVENRVGAGGLIGADYVAKSAPDGYTLCFCGTATISVAGLIGPKPNYDPERDLVAVSLISRANFFIATRPTFPANNLQELIRYAKANPGKLSWGNIGIGTPTHLGGELLKHVAGIDMLSISYKGEAPALTDLMGGQIDLYAPTVLAAASLVREGKLKPLASLNSQRSRLLPDVPTVAESGFPGFSADSFTGMNVAAGTPQAIVRRLTDSAMGAMKSPMAVQTMNDQGTTPEGSTAEYYSEFVRADRVKWAKLVKEANIREP